MMVVLRRQPNRESDDPRLIMQLEDGEGREWVPGRTRAHHRIFRPPDGRGAAPSPSSGPSRNAEAPNRTGPTDGEQIGRLHEHSIRLGGLTESRFIGHWF